MKVLSLNEALNGPYEISQSYSCKGWDDNGWVPVFMNVPDSERIVLAQLLERGAPHRIFFAFVRYRQRQWIWEGVPTDLVWGWKDLDSRCKVLEGNTLN